MDKLLPWLQIGQFAITVLTVLAGVFFAVASVRSATRSLSQTIDTLTESVNRLDESVKQINGRLDDARERIATLEGGKPK